MSTGGQGGLGLPELPVTPHPRIPASCTAKTPAARLGTAPRAWLPYRHEPARSVASWSWRPCGNQKGLPAMEALVQLNGVTKRYDSGAASVDLPRRGED